MSSMLADLNSHHIEGYAAAALHAGRDPREAYFSVPLISHIEGNLWMGGCVGGAKLPDDFVNVLSLYPWERYELGPETVRLEFKLYDAGEVPDYADAESIGIGMALSGKTLIHCQAGLNRSGLLSALVLRRLGRTSREAIDLLREKRSPLVLCNRAFEEHLLSLDGS